MLLRLSCNIGCATWNFYLPAAIGVRIAKSRLLDAATGLSFQIKDEEDVQNEDFHYRLCHSFHPAWTLKDICNSVELCYLYPACGKWRKHPLQKVLLAKCKDELVVAAIQTVFSSLLGFAAILPSSCTFVHCTFAPEQNTNCMNISDSDSTECQNFYSNVDKNKISQFSLRSCNSILHACIDHAVTFFRVHVGTDITFSRLLLLLSVALSSQKRAIESKSRLEAKLGDKMRIGYNSREGDIDMCGPHTVRFHFLQVTIVLNIKTKAATDIYCI